MYSSIVGGWWWECDYIELSMVFVSYLCVKSDNDGVCRCNLTNTLTVEAGFSFGESDVYKILLPLTF